ncbi:LPD29 domain-containing protein [Streptomyces albidoflavus]|uniref:LPD29 domain-containing protein n=1 Tax=Streptomyces sp. B29(2018) TaxID=2485016 RepID=UPI000FD6848B|nr:LPD29 domain-containing protein [Streptomyces sp. B29(2018)]
MTSATARRRLATAYLALRLTPGAQVRYVGTATRLHGPATVQPCSCGRCASDILLGIPAARYELRTTDGQPTGVSHVRHTSVIPEPTEEERGYAAIRLSTKATAVYLRQLLRRTFPGVKFSVRCGPKRAKERYLERYEITVTWSGGPTRTAVATVTAPLLARYGSPEECRPAWVSVTVDGHRHYGEPGALAIHLNRTAA